MFALSDGLLADVSVSTALAKCGVRCCEGNEGSTRDTVLAASFVEQDGGMVVDQDGLNVSGEIDDNSAQWRAWYIYPC